VNQSDGFSVPFSELAVNIKLFSNMRGRDTFIRLRACASDTTDGNRVVTSAISRFFVPKRERKDTVCEKSRWC